MLISQDRPSAGRPVEIVSGGYLPAAAGDAGHGQLRLVEHGRHEFFRNATYAVTGNSSALFMVRTDTWRKLGGFDDTNLPDRYGDLDYGTRAIAKGYVHYCTSAVSATLLEAAHAELAGAEEELAAYSCEQDLRQLAASSCVVEELKG